MYGPVWTHGTWIELFFGGQRIVTYCDHCGSIAGGWTGLDRVGFCHVATQGLSPETLDMAFMCCWLVGACGPCSKAGDAQMNALEMNR